RAVADGVVKAAGWKGQLGNTVEIDHVAPSAFTSLYGHLLRIASSIGPGTTVNKGQVIGYVGQTGCATGPHLHFALFAGDEYVNPLEIPAPPRAEKAVIDAARFDATKTKLLTALQSVPNDGPVRLTRVASLPISELE